MKILVFSWRDPKHPLAGGAEQVMHEHMKGWVAVGHKVTLFSSHFKGGLRKEQLDGIKIIRRGFQLIGVHIFGFLYYIFGKHEKFDLVVDQFHGIPFFTSLYNTRVPKLAVLQEVAREVWFTNQFPKPISWVVGWLGYFLEPFFFILYKKVPFMVGSVSAEKDIVQFGIPRKNITVIHHGVLLPKVIAVTKKEKKKTIMFLGALMRDKGVEDAIQAFAILNTKGDFSFWIVGKGPRAYIKYLKRLTAKLGISKRTTFFGFVTHKKKFELLARAHILINPSVREGWGLVNIEANIMGTPVVAYRSPGLVDSVKDGVSGILCKENTPEAMAEAVYGILTHKERFDKIKKSAVLWSKRLSWERSKKQSLKLIESLG